MKFKVGDYIENIGYYEKDFLYGIVELIVAGNASYSYFWIRTLILKSDMTLTFVDFKEEEIVFLTDEIKINKFNKLRVFK